MRTQAQRSGRDESVWRVPVTCLGVAWLLFLAVPPFTASLPSSDQPSQESSAASAKAQGAPDHSAAGMPASCEVTFRYDRIVDRHTFLDRRSSGGLRTLHAVL